MHFTRSHLGKPHHLTDQEGQQCALRPPSHTLLAKPAPDETSLYLLRTPAPRVCLASLVAIAPVSIQCNRGYSIEPQEWSLYSKISPNETHLEQLNLKSLTQTRNS
eukprot:GHVN01015085.1.p1 GENE.GHVN01015085.1~~GHVN01015085.1.p1  ORF type:complete len:106 (+),score=8.56 GHVN01015085.1:438-755(+)